MGPHSRAGEASRRSKAKLRRPGRMVVGRWADAGSRLWERDYIGDS